MLKLFRQIRKQLLTENRFSKYLIYAVGEILLIVIGIWIALSINNWNQDRLASIKEKELLSNVVEDLKYDHDVLQRLTDQSKRKQDLHIELYELSTRKSNANGDRLYSSEVLELIFLISKTWDNHQEAEREIYDRDIRSDLNSYFSDYKVLNDYVEIHNQAVIELREFNRHNEILNLDFVFNSNPYKQNSELLNELIRPEKMETYLGTAEFNSILIELYLSNQDAIQWMETLSVRNDLLTEAILKYID